MFVFDNMVTTSCKKSIGQPRYWLHKLFQYLHQNGLFVSNSDKINILLQTVILLVLCGIVIKKKKLEEKETGQVRVGPHAM